MLPSFMKQLYLAPDCLGDTGMGVGRPNRMIWVTVPLCQFPWGLKDPSSVLPLTT